jgi:hypothetical protein
LDTPCVLGISFPYYAFRKAKIIKEGAFRRPWAAHLAWYVRGYTPGEAGQVWDWVVEEFVKDHWRWDTRAILDDHRSSGDVVVLVSAGPAPLLHRIAREIDADHVVGTELELRDGQFSGAAWNQYASMRTARWRAYLKGNGLKWI